MKKIVTSLLAVLLVICIVGCDRVDSSTILEFSFSTSEPSDSRNEKSLYFSENKDSIVLNAQLEVDSGSVTLKITDNAGNNVWTNTYSQNETFNIEIKDIVSDSEYIFSIQAEQSKTVHLLVTSSDNLVKKVDKPAK